MKLKTFLTQTRWLVTIIMLLSLGIGNVWGVDNPATGSWTFGTSGNSSWTAVENGTGYCGGWGCKSTTTSYTVRTTNDVSDFTTILANPSNSNFSLTITVRGVCNSGTNKCTVTLLNSSNTKVGSLEKTIENGFGSGTGSSSAKDVEFTFTPTSTVARIQVVGFNKTAITKISYSLSYTSGPACSNKVTLTKDATSNGSFTLYSGSVSGSEISSGGKVDNCDNDAVVVVKPTANANYHVASVEATNKKSISGPDASGYYTITYTKGGNVSSTVTVTIAPDVTYTVTWMSNGSQVRKDTEVPSGTAKTPPTISPLPCGDKLMGWTDATDGVYVHGTSNLYTGATISITKDVTYYAVFADEE